MIALMPSMKFGKLRGELVTWRTMRVGEHKQHAPPAKFRERNCSPPYVGQIKGWCGHPGPETVPFNAAFSKRPFSGKMLLLLVSKGQPTRQSRHPVSTNG